ncbi:MAG TPA: protein-glutamate O-methyltransferase CheR [Jatrophihabitans sp.]|jgi:chemotaxis protein methyltransferase CheR|uniref:CheR family methyltransferase n=1 Tax=Jatrophihabitans sp. TaxID=1932789 RepID=UPI002E08AF4A|nr:protein-glutamate O-methyltransferase CheR [Jatrophihabitans sp.]
MTTVSTDDFTFVADFLRQRSAISIGPGKEYLVESRLTPLARDIGLADLNALIGELRRPFPDPSIRDRVVEAMTTNETSFFRDQHPFEAMRTTLVPQVIERNAGVRRLNIWSAASSTGQELYSIAMLLDSNFPELQNWDVTLMGTDLSTDVLARAREGRFSALEVNRGLPAPMMVRYFERAGAEYVVDANLRRWCTFKQMNLAEAWPVLPIFDIVFCRNVLIYFEIPVRQQILDKVRRTLTPGGHLLLGAAETTLGVVDGYSPVRIGNTVAYRVEA